MFLCISFEKSSKKCKDTYEINYYMILNPHRIEPTFLKLDYWSPGAGFIPIITSNILS